MKIARAHDVCGIDNISVYIGQTIPEAGTVKGLIRQTDGVSDPNSKHGDGRALLEFSVIIFFKLTILELELSCLKSSFYESVKLRSFSTNKDAFIRTINHVCDPTIACIQTQRSRVLRLAISTRTKSLIKL